MKAILGDNAGLLLRGIAKEDVERGRCWQAGIDQAHTKFTAQVYVLSKEEGGRQRRSSTNIVPNSTSGRRT